MTPIQITNTHYPINVVVVDTWGLDDETLSIIEPVMTCTGLEVLDETTFVVLVNSKKEVIKIFPERIQVHITNQINQSL